MYICSIRLYILCWKYDQVRIYAEQPQKLALSGKANAPKAGSKSYSTCNQNRKIREVLRQIMPYLVHTDTMDDKVKYKRKFIQTHVLCFSFVVMLILPLFSFFFSHQSSSLYQSPHFLFSLFIFSNLSCASPPIITGLLQVKKKTTP